MKRIYYQGKEYYHRGKWFYDDGQLVLKAYIEKKWREIVPVKKDLYGHPVYKAID